MASSTNSDLLDGVRRLFGEGTLTGLGSGSLLAKFVSRRDVDAFEVIIARHGPMVSGVCRRILRDSNDVEDAFQAVFLVLVKKAGSIRDGDNLGPWLHGVAHRVATRSRQNIARRRKVEGASSSVDLATFDHDTDRVELRMIVDEEIGRLPDHYRRLVVLCDLEGITQAEAAKRLDWTEGTVRGRLAKARSLLRSRLTRRGLAAPAGMLAGVLLPDEVSASRLIRTTLDVALGGSESTSVAALALAEGLTLKITPSHLVSALLGCLLVGSAAAGVGFGIAQARKSAETTNVELPALPVGKPPGLPDPIDTASLKDEPEAETAGTHRIAIGDSLSIEVLEALPGRPISGERLVRPDGTIGLGFYGDLKVAGLTRREAKVKLIALLRNSLTDQCLGLVAFDETSRQNHWVHPARSGRVFIDDTSTFANYASTTADRRIEALEMKLDKLLAERDALKKHVPIGSKP